MDVQIPVLDLSEPDVWSKGWFQEKVIAALRHDGFADEQLNFVRDVFAGDLLKDFDAFKTAAKTRLESLPAAKRLELERVASHMEKVISFNRRIYFPRNPTEVQQRFWPNNPKLLATNWHSYADIFETDFFIEPNRFITPQTPIGSAGSCFAAAISRQLQYWGYNYVLELGKRPDDRDNPDAYETDPAHCGVIYSAPVMRQMVERAFGEWIPEKIVLRSKPEIVDPFRAYTYTKDWDSYHRDYNNHNAALRRALEKCEVFIITLGMTETWYFADDGRFTNATPRGKESVLLRHKNLSVAENVSELERLYEIYNRYRPGIKLIISVSPVPINSTFNVDRHVVVANSLSKSTLRVAAEEFCRKHSDNCFYFPSFELVTYGTREPWEIDRRHVSADAVTRVMRQFQRMFFVEQNAYPILADTPIAELFSSKRNYWLYWARRVIRPIKRKLGIENQGFSQAARDWIRRQIDRLHPPLS